MPAAKWRIAINTLKQNYECHSSAPGTHADHAGIMQATILYLFAGATIRAKAAFRFNQSIITYFYIIITCFNLIITHGNIVIILILPHYIITSLLR